MMQAQDLPSPAANLQTLPSGSYVIPMDNTYQLNTSSLFNLKAYGLVVYLLNNHVKVKWVIKSGKLKDGIDFSTTVQQVHPGTSVPAAASFIGGPFVIFSSDLTGVDALVNAYYSAAGLTGADRPSVYQTTAAATVDIRYDLTGLLPKAGILTDGGNQSIHLAFMTAAGIPASNYTTTTGSNLISGCYTFASEPHNSKTGATVDSSIASIRRFVLSGGNFLAECAAISNYENNALGRFQTTTGITVTNTAIGTSVTYTNPDLSFSQFQGVYNGSLTGSVENWTINGAGINHEHSHVTGTGANASVISASVSKLASGLGGMVFYLGNHNYTTADQQNINGIRMYMNAFLTPSPTICGITSLPVDFIQFTAALTSGHVQLQWEVTQQVNNKGFSVERSTDGINWHSIGFIQGAGSSAGDNVYSYTDDAPSNAINYYRLRQEDYDGQYKYSEVKEVNLDQVNADVVAIWPNPASNQLSIRVPQLSKGSSQGQVYDLSGKLVMLPVLQSGVNTVNIQNLPMGTYIFHLVMQGGRVVNQKFNKL